MIVSLRCVKALKTSPSVRLRIWNRQRDQRLISLKKVFFDERVGIGRAPGQNVLSPQEEVVAIFSIDSGEIARAFYIFRSHSHIDMLSRRQEIGVDSNRLSDRP